MRLSLSRVIPLVAVIVTLASCGKSETFSTAQVSGCVKCNGKLVTAGTVVFIPAGIDPEKEKTNDTGRAASGVIKPDGTYELSTYRTGDGAIIGPHKVQVFAPAPIDDDAPQTEATIYVCGKAPLEKMVDEGENVIDLELTTRK